MTNPRVHRRPYTGRGRGSLLSNRGWALARARERRFRPERVPVGEAIGRVVVNSWRGDGRYRRPTEDRRGVLEYGLLQESHATRSGRLRQ